MNTGGKEASFMSRTHWMPSRGPLALVALALSCAIALALEPGVVVPASPSSVAAAPTSGALPRALAGYDPAAPFEPVHAIAPAGAVNFTPVSTPHPNAVVDLINETFEGNFPTGAWTLSGNPTWAPDNFKPKDGTFSAWCARGGAAGRDPGEPGGQQTQTYANGMNAWMTYGPFSLADAEAASFSFDYWSKTESGSDYFSWLVSKDGSNFYGGQKTGDSFGWVNVSMNLANVPTLGSVLGQSQVWIALRFISDSSVSNYAGTFVDNVKISRTGKPDLVAQEVYFRTEPASGGVVINHPTPGMVVYPHFSYRLDGDAAVSGTIYRISVDDVAVCSANKTFQPGSELVWCESGYMVTPGPHTLKGAVDPNGTIAETSEANNQVTRDFGEAPTLDLIAMQVMFRDQPNGLGNVVPTPCVGEVVYPHFVFEVAGAGTVTGDVFALDLDGTPLCSSTAPVTTGIYTMSCPASWTVTPGNHTVTGRLDPGDTVAEFSEVNNTGVFDVIECTEPHIRVAPTLARVNCEAPARAAAETAIVASPDKLTNKELIQKDLAAKGTARVLVTIQQPAGVPIGADLSDARVGPRARRAIQTGQNALLARLNPQAFKLRRRFENQPTLWMEVSEAGLAALQGDASVVAIEPDVEVPANLAQGLPLMGAMTYRSQYDGTGVSIAICDSGIDYLHPKLGGGAFPNSKVIGGYDVGENDADPAPDSPGSAHGTACAGIAAGDLGASGDYIGGVAPGAKLYALKIVTASSPGSSSTGAIAAAWDWCVTHKNDDLNNPILVISTSFSGGRFYATCDGAWPAVTAAANNAVAAGITVFGSVGNDGYCDSISSPACNTNVISVGAVYDSGFGTYFPCVDPVSCVPKTFDSCPYATDVTAADKVTSYSNSASFLALLAPANRAYTTDISGGGGYTGSDYTTSFGGTSAACPYAAGAAASLQHAARQLTGAYLPPALVRERLTTSGTPILDPKSNVTTPRVNLAAAIESIPPAADPGCLRIFNDGGGVLTVSAIDAPAWAVLIPAPPFELGPKQSVQVCVQACSACDGQDLDAPLVIHSNDDNLPVVEASVHVDCEPPPPVTLSNWRSVRSHSGIGALGLVLHPTATGNGASGPSAEPRIGGIQRLMVDFNRPVVLMDLAAISIQGRTTVSNVLHSPVSYVPASVQLADLDTLEIRFSPALPNDTCFTVTLLDALILGGITGDRNVNIRGLAGDVNSTGDANVGDTLEVKSKVNLLASQAPASDVNCTGGKINVGDTLSTKAQIGHKALCP